MGILIIAALLGTTTPEASAAEPGALVAHEGADAGEATAANPAPAASDEPGAFGRWWNGHESIYANGTYLSLGFQMGSYNSGEFSTKGVLKDGKGLNKGDTSGIGGELGIMGRYFGFLVIGGSYFTTKDGAELEFEGGVKAPVSITAADIRLMHPRLRFALWRFELAARAGATAHLGWAKVDEPSLLPAGKLKDAADSSVYATLAGEVAGSLRFYPLSFVYGEVGYGTSFSLWDIAGKTSGLSGLHLGAGLSF